MQWLQGRPLASRLEAYCQRYHQRYYQQFSHPIGLGVIRIGDNPASRIYVRYKRRAAERIGFCFHEQHFPAAVSPKIVEDHIAQWAQDPQMHGMILQLPLPNGHDKDRYLSLIPPEKDIDGLHPCNPAKAGFLPCTPLGCWLLLTYYGVPIEGAHCVIVGRSTLVGLPLALLLLKSGGTVTITHRQTRDLPSFTRQADILCVCAGHPHLITRQHVKPDAVILDIGIHSTPQGIQGDVDPEVIGHVKALTPVPGGIGPMTVACLMWNTVYAAFGQRGQHLSLHDFLT